MFYQVEQTTSLGEWCSDYDAENVLVGESNKLSGLPKMPSKCKILESVRQKVSAQIGIEQWLKEFKRVTI